MNTLIVAGIVGGLCLMPFASALPVTAQAVNVVADAQTAANDKVTLPDGVTVELMGVTQYDGGTTPARWWKPDGTPLAAPLYTPTLLQLEYKGRKFSKFRPNLTFSLKVSGISDTEARFTRSFSPGAMVSGGTVNPFVPHAKTYLLYEVEARFTRNPQTAAMRFKIARGQWQTEASATVQPSVVHVSDALTVTFDKPGKEEAGMETHTGDYSTGKSSKSPRVSELAVIVRFEKSQTEDDADRRVVVVDDQGKTIPLGGSHVLVYGPDQTGKSEIHLLVTIPDTLRGHLRQYQLQTRPYQYADFPNIHLKPTTAVQP